MYENNKLENLKKKGKTQRTCICGAGLTSNPPVIVDGNTCWKCAPIRRSFSRFSLSYALLYKATSSWYFCNASRRFVSLLSAITFSLGSFLKYEVVPQLTYVVVDRLSLLISHSHAGNVSDPAQFILNNYTSIHNRRLSAIGLAIKCTRVWLGCTAWNIYKHNWIVLIDALTQPFICLLYSAKVLSHVTPGKEKFLHSKAGNNFKIMKSLYGKINLALISTSVDTIIYFQNCSGFHGSCGETDRTGSDPRIWIADGSSFAHRILRG